MHRHSPTLTSAKSDTEGVIMANNEKDPKGQDPNLAEEVLRQGGKSEDEVKRTGAIDRAEDEYEKTLDAKFRTVNSPVHKAVWDRTIPVGLFGPGDRSRATMPATKPMKMIQRMVVMASFPRRRGT